MCVLIEMKKSFYASVMPSILIGALILTVESGECFRFYWVNQPLLLTFY